jgi:hypothetical protein
MPTNLDKARAGIHFVVAELHRRGARSVTVAQTGQTFEISATDPQSDRRVTLRVKTKTVGDWQTSTRLGEPREPDPNESRFWTLVDIGKDPSTAPRYFVIPEWWVLNYIHNEIESHLAHHGGVRPVSPDSTHCAIRPADIEEWRDRWDVLGIALAT